MGISWPTLAERCPRVTTIDHPWHDERVAPHRPPGLVGLFYRKVARMLLRASVVMDYQNVHLTGHGLFDRTRFGPPHDALLDPLHFGNQLVQTRNKRQRAGMAAAELARVQVYRGLPSANHDPKAYARSQAQKSNWERDPRVGVHLRPLKYDYERDHTGAKVIGPDGQYIIKGKQGEGRRRLVRTCPRS